MGRASVRIWGADWFQPPPSPVVVVLSASDPTYTAVHCWRSCVSGGWKPPLEQSAARRHLSSNADCFEQLYLSASDRKRKKKLNNYTIQHNETKSIDRLSSDRTSIKCHKIYKDNWESLKKRVFGTAQNLSLFPIISFLFTVASCVHRVVV